MKTFTLAIAVALATAAPALAENYVDADKLSWAESFKIYMEYFPRSVGM